MKELELVYVTGTVVVAAGLLTLVAIKAGAVLAKLERWFTMGSTGIILFIMAFVCVEVTARYLFNSPIPGHLEGTQLLVTFFVFGAISYAQQQNAHVGMTLITDMLPENVRRYTEIVTLILSVLTCSVLAYFAYKLSLDHYQLDNVTETPPYWHTWESSGMVAVGYFMISIRMWLQALHLIAPNYYPQDDIVLDEELLAEQDRPVPTE